ncbi:helix-turn-helix transcriptional regulator [Priestia endophytica]|uniref:helix-turn-helix domain-containing protein n=1 Tax=Priestia endophytica TaxID=135735 RepID=UPI003D2D9D3C
MKVKVGELLRLKRIEKGYTLETLSSIIGISINYIAAIEKGTKTNPSDSIIVKLAETYGLNEDDLFIAFDKMPLSAKQEVTEHPELAKALSQIRNDKEMSHEKKEALYKKLTTWYKRLSEEE